MDWYAHLFDGHDDEQLADLANVVRDAADRAGVPIWCPSDATAIPLGDQQVS
jgi:hypothetical protein